MPETSKSHRRIVTGHINGKAAILSDQRREAYQFSAVPGFEHTFVWATSDPSETDHEQVEARLPTSALPVPGGSLVQIVTFPPEHIRRSAEIDPAAAGAEYGARLPGLAETFEHDGSEMHKTPTIDYAIIQEGELSLEMDDGEIVDLSAGDIVVQQATRHGWRNRSDKPATIIFVMLGFKP